MRHALFALATLSIVSLILNSDLLLHAGRPNSFDGNVHITAISQFHQSMSAGEWFVRWAPGWANYGFPLPIVHQQVPSYAGGLLMFITRDAVGSYNLLLLLSTFISCALFYFFMRYYVNPIASIGAAILFNFAPYRIMNIYLRGALPEYFATIFLPLLLIGMYQLLCKSRWWGSILILISLVGLLLTHPMTVVIYSTIFIPYGLYISWPYHKKKKLLSTLAVSVVLAGIISSYYLLPLLVEIKYFVYGQTINHFSPDKFLTISNLLDPRWWYHGTHPGTRKEFLKPGVLEMVVYLVGLVLAFRLVALRYLRGKKLDHHARLLLLWTGIGLLILFLLLPFSNFLYLNFPPLNNIQFPWRMLSAFIFIPAIIFGLLVTKLPRLLQVIVVLLTIALIACMRFPQLYGKNFVWLPERNYAFTTTNLHTINMNTLWMGRSEEYPIRDEKVAILDGEAVIEQVQIFNSRREYKITATTDTLMADYTFYFPGWTVYVDGAQVPIEFQNPDFRGILTYVVPAGNHQVIVDFEETRVRKLANALSISGMIIALIFFLFIKKIVGADVSHKTTKVA